MKVLEGVGALQVALAGAPLDVADARCLAGATLRQRLSMPAQLELVFRGATQELTERVLLLVGLSVTVRADPDGALLFDGDVTAVEHGYSSDGELEVRIRGYDRMHRLRKRQTVRAFTDLDVADVARQMADPIGLSVEASEAGPRQSQIVQWRQSDLALLADVAARAGLYLAASSDRLELFSLAGAGHPIDLRLGDDLFEADLELNGDDAIDAVAALGWDPLTGRRFEESAGDARSGRTAGARVPVADLGGDGIRTLPNVVALEADAVRAAAQGGLDRAVARQVVVRGVAAGHAGIRPGARVRVQGVALGFEGEYVITEATHTVDPERGYVTRFSTEPPPSGSSPAAAVVAPGIVERVDDPEQLGRVSVSLPTLSPVETGWMRVLLPAAGSQAGLVALPAVGDEVLVLFPGGEPFGGVVLGGLHTPNDPPDFGIVEGQVRRYRWRTRAGQEIELDEAGQRILLRTPNGSAITLGEERLSILAATDIDIAAPGRTITIRAKAVDFERADQPADEPAEEPTDS